MNNNEKLLKAIGERHSVRSYEDKRIDDAARGVLQAEIEACNKEGGLHLQLITDEPAAFGGFMAKYGKFSGVQNYIACVGKKASDLEERLGYYGERLVLLAQTLGLNTCWVALTFSKGKSTCVVNSGEKLVCVIALGYGSTQGISHKVKTAEEVSSIEAVAAGEMADAAAPKWFADGVQAALLAPTAMNQQKFKLTLRGDKVAAESTGGFYSKVDLGIVKYHFEIGAGKDSTVWA